MIEMKHWRQSSQAEANVHTKNKECQKRSKDKKDLKTQTKTLGDKGKQRESAQTEQDKGRLTGRKGEHGNIHTADIVILCSSVLMMRASSETDSLVPTGPRAKHIPVSLLRSPTQWPSDGD